MTSRTHLLQRSHIKLVSYPHKVNSEYHDEYVPRSVQGSSIDPGVASANLRKSHFSISGDHTANLGLSEHQAEFIERPFDVQESAISLHHKPDNINLVQGSRMPEGESVYTHDYKPYPVGSGAVLPAANMALQRSHFEVAPGSSKVPLGQSIQQTDFVKHPIDPTRQLLDTATLQKSHFPATNEGFKEKYSETQDEYRPYLTGSNYDELVAKPVNMALRRSHIDQGFDPSGPRSSETRDMLNQTAGVRGDKWDNMDPTALRKSHLPYPMQAQMLTKQTEHQANYVNYPGYVPSGLLKPEFEDTKKHVLNPASSEDKNLSETAAQYVVYDPKQLNDAHYQPSDLKDRIQRTSGFINLNPATAKFGGESEFMDNYNKVPNINMRSSLDPDAAQRLRRSHLSELSGANPFQNATTTSDMLLQSKPYTGQKLVDVADMGLRDSHIMKETAGGKFFSNTEYNSKYVAFDNCASAPVDGSGLRKTHFMVGDNTRFDGESTYHADYQPKPLEGNRWEFKEEEYAYL